MRRPKILVTTLAAAATVVGGGTAFVVSAAGTDSAKTQTSDTVTAQHARTSQGSPKGPLPDPGAVTVTAESP